MKITFLGTGNASVTECYNTCFLLEKDQEFFLVDGGGGNGLFVQLKKIGVDWQQIRHIFVTHKHLDHMMGIMWLIRFFSQKITRTHMEGDVYFYGHEEVTSVLYQMAHLLLQPKEYDQIGKQIHLVTLEDGDTFPVLGYEGTAFDIGSTKDRQFGFSVCYEGKKFTCLGDEPYRELVHSFAAGSDWLLHEAFCLLEDADRFKPYEKHHSTAKDAGAVAEALKVKNLILYHTEDKTIGTRKERYTKEAKAVFSGAVYVPNDLESIEL